MKKIFSQSHCITYDGPKSKKSYRSILLPPPNITGALHIGHALSSTLQDVLIRFWKMEGYHVKWQLGTDHAGIATEIMVKRYLEKNNIIYNSKEELLQHIIEWVEKHKNIIFHQMEKMGFDINSSLRYTMDEEYIASVRQKFNILLNEGLIAKDKRLVNWDCSTQSAISDLEVNHLQRKAKLYYIAYQLCDKQDIVIVATTRPETIFADQALAVSEKRQDLVGAEVFIPIINKRIPIIIDEHAQNDLGSGIVKITPAHDFNDFEVGKRNNLNLDFSILDIHGLLNENVPKTYQGLSVQDARTKIIHELHIVKIEEIESTIPISSRTGAIIEPMISDQWFMDMSILSKKALNRIDEINFNHNWKNVYRDWLEKIKPWCISRQITWGHKIPNDCDVLDTWFSSSLWALETMTKKEMEHFYPFTVLITAHDILFFWVARMSMMSIHLSNTIPFNKVLLHPLVLDKNGNKMSKTKGNVINPLDIIDEYGSDALRLYLANMSCAVHSVKFDSTHIKGYKHLVTKLWNSARCLFNLQKRWNIEYIEPKSELDKWMMQKMKDLIHQYRYNMDNCIYNTDYLVEVFRNDFCDIYLEFAKRTDSQCWEFFFSAFVSMFYPFMPFVSSSILKSLNGNDFIIPEINSIYESSFQHIVYIIKKIFKLKSIYNAQNFLMSSIEENEYYIAISKITSINISFEEQYSGLQIQSGKYIIQTNIIDMNPLMKSKNYTIQMINKYLSILSNEQFLHNAKQEVLNEKILLVKNFIDNLRDILLIDINLDYSVLESFESRLHDISVNISSR